MQPNSHSIGRLVSRLIFFCYLLFLANLIILTAASGRSVWVKKYLMLIIHIEKAG